MAPSLRNRDRKEAPNKSEPALPLKRKTQAEAADPSPRKKATQKSSSAPTQQRKTKDAATKPSPPQKLFEMPAPPPTTAKAAESPRPDESMAQYYMRVFRDPLPATPSTAGYVADAEKSPFAREKGFLGRKSTRRAMTRGEADEDEEDPVVATVFKAQIRETRTALERGLRSVKWMETFLSRI